MKFNSRKEKEDFLKKLTLDNLKKVAKFGKIATPGKITKKTIIDKIIDFDSKNDDMIINFVVKNREKYATFKTQAIKVGKTQTLKMGKTQSLKLGKTQSLKLGNQSSTKSISVSPTLEKMNSEVAKSFSNLTESTKYKIYLPEQLALMNEQQLDVLCDIHSILQINRTDKVKTIKAILLAQTDIKFIRKSLSSEKKFENFVPTNAISSLEDRPVVIKGLIVEIKSQVYKVQLTKSVEKPIIGSIFKAKLPNGETRILEVSDIINEKLVSTFVLGKEQGLTIGTELESKNQPYSLPISEAILGRVVDPVGRILDNPSYKLTGKLYTPMQVSGKYEKQRYDIIPKTEILETGIKVIDILLPIPKGGKTGLLGGAGVGKTIVVQELINTFIKHHDGLSIFTGIGERIREGHELWKEAGELGFLSKTTFIFGQMNESPGLRFRSGFTGVKVAEYFRNNLGKSVLLFMDNIFRYVQAGSEISTLLEKTPSAVGYQPTLVSEMGKLQERINSTMDGDITSIQAMYIPADDFTDPAAVAAFAHFDSTIILSRQLAAEGIYPAVDPLASSSKLLSRKYTSQKHINIAKSTIKFLEKLKSLEDIINILGFDSLTEVDKKNVRIGRRAKRFLTQPFVISEKFSGMKGKFVTLEESLSSMEKILSGELNHIPDSFFSYVGVVEEVITKYEASLEETKTL
ncbi:MAG: MMOB1670 family gliding motility ATPase complex subunit [Metamycoplasmataceae bacterium]